MDWIDVALLNDEAGVSSAINGLNDADRANALARLGGALGLTAADIERAAFRLLIERVRPLTLPSSLWSRPVTASDNPDTMIRAHFGRMGIPVTPDRVRHANQLYLQFAEERERIKVTADALESCGYRCQHCGMAFCEEQIGHKGFTSPFGSRGLGKNDPLKPHWHAEPDMLEPTTDHHWPVSLYGSNGLSNRRVLCKGCNAGKENCLAIEQRPSWVGMARRQSFLAQGPIPYELFYTQLRRAPVCAVSGKSATETELTVELEEPNAPAVLDNLITVESPGL